MEPLLRLGAAAVDEGQPAVAESLWRQTAAADDLIALLDADGSAVVTVDGHEVERTADGNEQPVVTVDGSAVAVDDLTTDELVLGVEVLLEDTGAHGSVHGGLDGLLDRATGDIERVRLRLLLEDLLFNPTARAVALDRLERSVAGERRKDRDVSGLFDA